MMKKVFFAFAIAGMFGFAACGSNNTAETVDTLAEEVAVVEENAEEIVDTTAVEAAAVEEVVTEAAAE